MKSGIKYFVDTITSRAYWKYILFSKSGFASILGIFGGIYLVIEALDFFNVYTRDKYASFAFFIFFALSVLVSIGIRRPIKSISITLPKNDICIEVCIADIFEINGAAVISTNSKFEADVSGGKIATDSLQGQFTAKYFTGNQIELITKIEEELSEIQGSIPYPMGTTVPISTHGKMFYFTVMADLNEHGNAITTIEKVKSSLDGLWNYVRESGELQELVIPVIGTGRGRLKTSRKRMITLIAESFMKSSEQNKATEKLVIVIRPEDAKNFEVNLYDIKDNLNHILLS
ncbi:MAG: hypothetical protein FH753_17495 [Firmicutes bacterium]|nr:hypothetical protein [Bacillota bacterium]